MAEEPSNTFDKRNHDIALLGLWNGGNFGAMITARALYDLLTNLGYDVLLVDTALNYGTRNDEMLRYITDNCTCSCKYQRKSDFYELNSICDCFIIGSDQCWNPNLNRMYGGLFMLDFIKSGKKMLTYATSFGHAYFDGNEEEENDYRYYLKRFNAISVREAEGVKICAELGIKGVKHVIDPIFFLKEHRIGLKEKNKYGLCYILDIKNETQTIIDKAEEAFGYPGKVILGLDYTNTNNLSLKNVCTVDSVDDFINGFANAEYVITDSYHGMCLAIMFNKPFRVIINEGRGRARFESLIRKLSLEQCVIDGDFSVAGDIPRIDWEKVNDKVSAFKEESLVWLKRSMAKEQGFSDDDILFLEDRIYLLEKHIDHLNIENEQLREQVKNPTYNRVRRYMEKQLKENSTVAIRGGGVHTRILLRFLLPIMKERSISFQVFDQTPGEIVDFEEVVPVVPVSADYIRQADVVIMSVWKYRDEVLTELKGILKDNKTTRVIDVYADLNLDATYPFYDYRIDENVD